MKNIPATVITNKRYSLVSDSELNRMPMSYIESLRMSKGEIFKTLETQRITFDYAMPQDWLDSFVKESGLPYDMVLSSTVFVYRGFEHGPASCCAEVQEALERFYYCS